MRSINTERRAAAAREQKKRRDRKEKWGCMDTADMALVVFHSDLSALSKNINSEFYLSDVLEK